MLDIHKVPQPIKNKETLTVWTVPVLHGPLAKYVKLRVRMRRECVSHNIPLANSLNDS